MYSMVQGISIIPSVDNKLLLQCNGSNSRSWPVFYLTMSIIFFCTAHNVEPASGDTMSTIVTSKRSSFDLLESTAEKLHMKQAATRFDRHLIVSRHAGSDVEGMRALVGSSPPKCIKKCRACIPCKSVLVPIHTISRETPTQYYPEAWRCECKGKIYNP